MSEFHKQKIKKMLEVSYGRKGTSVREKLDNFWKIISLSKNEVREKDAIRGCLRVRDCELNIAHSIYAFPRKPFLRDGIQAI